MLPLAAGLLILTLPITNRWLATGCLLLSGVTVGLGTPLKTALWAELYGIRQITRVRSWIATVVVLSTAAGPPALGYALDANFGLMPSLRATAVSIIIYSVLCIYLRRIGKI